VQRQPSGNGWGIIYSAGQGAEVPSLGSGHSNLRWRGHYGLVPDYLLQVNSSPQSPLADIQIISTVFACSVIREGFGKLYSMQESYSYKKFVHKILCIKYRYL
jgi:hypothetical protein